MMTTPICDFVREYIKTNAVRLHMPAHKGLPFLGFEAFDITEINGADSLYEASGIIAESEKNASALFEADTFYSTEGSSLCIRAMVYLLKITENPLIIASRNAHKSFITAAALTDSDIHWLSPSENNYLESEINLAELETVLKNTERKSAVYITSPDYLGNIAPIKEIADICKKYGALLAVDNAHGAYLKFLPDSLHPIDLGADICCDSAHKTLPVLTGGAYLHISSNAPSILKERAKDALSLFGSTSPSYIILQSLDNANKYIYNEYKDKLRQYISLIDSAKKNLSDNGFTLKGNEPLKIVIDSKQYGYFGHEIASFLEKNGIVCEFYDRDNIVFMLSTENGIEGIDRLTDTLSALPKKSVIDEASPRISLPERALSVRDSIFADSETLDVKSSEGRIFAGTNIACPPAVPLIVAGEIINSDTIEAFNYYGITECRVIKN